MFGQIFAFLLEVASGLVAGACLLRLYMQLLRVPFGNPVGQLVFALSDWLVLPLRRGDSPSGKVDLSCLLGAVLVQLLHYLVLWAVLGGRSQPGTDPVAGAVWPAAHGLDRVDRHFAHPRHIVLGATARPRGPHFGAAVRAGAAPTAAHHSAGGQC